MRTDGAILAALFAFALAARLVPLTFSALPYDMQGFALSRIADTIVARGSWQLDPADLNSYNAKMPGFSLLWGATIQLGGLHSLVHVQPYLALLTSTCVLAGYLLGLKASGRRLVGFVSASFLVLFGSYLMLTSTVTKESLGLVVFPVALLMFHERRDPRKRALALVVLVLLPFVHHLTTLMALAVAASMAWMTAARDRARGRSSMRGLALDAVTISVPAAISLLYYEAVDMTFFSDVTTTGSLTLLLAIAVLLGAFLASMWRPRRFPLRGRLAVAARPVFLVPVAGFGVILVNAETTLFVGGSETRPALLAILPWLAVLAGFAVLGYHVVRRTSNRVNDLLVSMLAAPAVLILFGFLRGLDGFSFLAVYRSADFLDYAFAVFAAIGFVTVWRVGRHRAARAALVAGFLAALVGTTPMAWNHPDVFGTENVVTEEEFDALAFVASLGAERVASEPRLVDVAAYWFGLRGDSTFLYRLVRNESVAGVDYAVILERWSTAGVRVPSLPDVVVDASLLSAFLQFHRVLRVAGPVGDRVFVVQVLPPLVARSI